MFASRFIALLDACVLAPALTRNLLLSLAEADFYRPRWSRQILDETERAIERILQGKGAVDSSQRALRARVAMERAFDEACVEGYEDVEGAVPTLPDAADSHVVAAAIKTGAAVIVTDNVKDFPAVALGRLNLEARSADTFIADTIDLDASRAVPALKRMRERLNRPEKTAEILLLDMERFGLVQTVDVLKPHILSL